MTTKEITNELIGRRCRCIFTGLMVEGTITEIIEDKYVKGVMVEFDQPQQWGDDLYRRTDATARKIDEFGTLHHLQLL